MGRRKLSSLEDFAKALRNGYGIGKGEDYKPWVGIRDVPSSGRSSLIPGLTVNRGHQTFSDLETNTFYGVEWKSNVVDIREQFPILPRDVVMGIAERYGIKYPNIPKTKEPAILTTDLLATVIVDSGETYVPIECKYASDLLIKRELDKLEIKRLFWAALGYEQRIVTEEQIDPIAAENLAFVSAPLRGELAPTHQAQAIQEIVGVIPARTYTIDSLIDHVCEAEKVDTDVGRHILFDLIWHRCLKVDISVSIQESGLISVHGWDLQALDDVQDKSHAVTA